MSSPTKLLFALALASSAIAFNAIAQTAKVYNFKVTYDGSTQSLADGSNPITGTVLNVGDRFVLDIRAAGGGFFESKTANVNATNMFPFACFLPAESATRTGNVTTKLLLNGTIVSQITELNKNQSSVHIGADLPPPPLSVGLRFDQILVEYEFLAISPATASTTITSPASTFPGRGGLVFWSSFTNPDLFAFNQGFVSEVLASDLKFPQGVAVWRPAGASKDVIYIADRSGHRVWKLDLNASVPTLELVAGTGVQGYFGDGGLAPQAQLNGPASVAVDANGNIFVADAGNHIIRMINPSGTITTVAGTPKTLPPIVNGQLSLGNGGPATLAFLNGPRGVAVAGGRLYIADTMNQQVRFVEGGMISALAGVAGSTGAEDGPVSSAKLNDARGLAVDGNGNVYIAEVGNNRIRKVDAKTLTVSSAVVGLRAPAGVAVAADGTLYISDTSNHRVLRVATTGAITTVAGTGTPGPAAQQLNTPIGLAVDANGDLYIADQLNNRVVRVDFTP